MAVSGLLPPWSFVNSINRYLKGVINSDHYEMKLYSAFDMLIRTDLFVAAQFVRDRISSKKCYTIRYKGLEHPIHLRKGTTDIKCFETVILEKQYDLPYSNDVKVIIDCGANIGLTTVFFKNKYPNAMIIAIEPETENFDMLVMNTSLYTNIFCLKAAISDRSGTVNIVDKGMGNWGFITSDSEQGAIQSVTIPEIMDLYNIGSVDILKMDIEGSEKQVFEAASMEWLDTVSEIVVELHDRLLPGCSDAYYKAIALFDPISMEHGENVHTKLRKYRKESSGC